MTRAEQERISSSAVPAVRGGIDSRNEEPLVSGMAARQHGLVTRAQRLNAGLSSGRIDRRVAARRLRPVQRGVYQVGPIASPLAREMAAVLACGGGAHLSHWTAVVLWALLPLDRSGPVHVTVGGRDRRQRPGVVVHYSPILERTELTKVEGIPITSPARTLFDIASVARGRELEQAIAQAEKRGLTDRSELLSLMSRHSRRPGMRALRHILEEGVDPAMTRSEAEERFLTLIRKARVAEPKVNSRVGSYEVDFLWPRERVIVEVDGFAFHSSRGRFEADHRRDADLSAMGFQVVRLTWHQVTREPEIVLVRLAQALARSGRR